MLNVFGIEINMITMVPRMSHSWEMMVTMMIAYYGGHDAYLQMHQRVLKIVKVSSSVAQVNNKRFQLLVFVDKK
jgi:hypothetical protein